MAVKMAPNDPPGGENFRLSLPDRGGLNHGRGKAVESQSEEASSVAAETARDVPKRGTQEYSKGQRTRTSAAP